MNYSTSIIPGVSECTHSERPTGTRAKRVLNGLKNYPSPLYFRHCNNKAQNGRSILATNSPNILSCRHCTAMRLTSSDSLCTRLLIEPGTTGHRDVSWPGEPAEIRTSIVTTHTTTWMVIFGDDAGHLAPNFQSLFGHSSLVLDHGLQLQWLETRLEGSRAPYKSRWMDENGKPIYAPKDRI